MKLIWNPKESCFEAEFQDFQGDLAAVKAAGFKTSGPPEWKWFTFKIEALEKLRKNRPASGLTILEDALKQYNRIKEEENNKTALLAELKAKKKAAKIEDKSYQPVPEGQEFGYNCIPDAEPTIRVGYIPPVWTGPVCIICKEPVYEYEKQEPPTCIWCEIQLDNAPNLF